MFTYEVVFYLDNEIVEEVYLQAEDFEQATQVLLLKLNTRRGIPSIWNKYIGPILLAYP